MSSEMFTHIHTSIYIYCCCTETSVIEDYKHHKLEKMKPNLHSLGGIPIIINAVVTLTACVLIFSVINSAY